MQKKFLLNLLLILFLNLLIKPFWVFGIDLKVQNTIGAEEYGLYFTLLNFSFLFNIILDMGITSFNNKNIAQNSFLLSKHFPGISFLKITLGLIYGTLLIITGLIIGYNDAQLKLLCIIGINQFLLSFILYLRSNISGLLMFKTDSLLSVLDRVLMIAFCSILLWTHIFHGKFNIRWFVYAQFFAYLLTAIIAGIIVIRKSSFKKLSWNIPFFLIILRQSFPYAVLVLLMAFYNRVDSVFIERLLSGSEGKRQAGIYAQAFRILDALNMISYLFAVLLLPMFANMIKSKTPITGLIRTSFSILFAGSVFIAIPGIFYSSEIMTSLYPHHLNETLQQYQDRLHESTLIFQLLIPVFIAISTSYVFGTLLTANGSLKILNISAAIGMAISILLNIILIPRIQAIGAAYASLVSQYITAIIQVIAALAIFRIKPDWIFLLRLLIYTLLVFSLCILIGKLNLIWYQKLGFTIILLFVISIILKIINIPYFYRTIMEKQPEG